jgi:cobaltochelatase CobS subunit
MSPESQIRTMMEQYIRVDKDSPYNNRRNKLRKLADAMFGCFLEDTQKQAHHKVQDLFEYLEVSRSLDRAKGLKPTFNSLRGALSPAVLEEFVMYVCCHSPFLASRGYSSSEMNIAALRWVTESATLMAQELTEDDYDPKTASPWGSTKYSVEHDYFLSLVREEFKYAEVGGASLVEDDIKIEIKKGVSMSSGTRINLQAEHKVAIDAILQLSGSGSIDGINGQMDEMFANAETAKEEARSLATRLATSMSAVSAPTTVSGTVDGELPNGEVVFKVASEVFHELASSYSGPMLNFKVPTFEWEGVHPDVPSVDVNYKFDMTALFRVLQGIVDGNNSYLYGHTGTGKSTLVEQVCAHLKFPLVRVNFDSEISRMDLIGRDTLVTVDGQTVSKFVDGVLPDALSRPCLLLCDEVDFVRPDVMYVFQRVLEGNGLMISEDGGRRVDANPWFRLIATANTVGQGDDTAMYQGARAQSMATLDRFENWVEMGYMKAAVETKWLRGVTDGLSSRHALLFIKYAEEHRDAFINGMIMQPLSPRGLRAMAKRFQTVLALTGDQSESMREAFGATVLARCTQQDKIVLDGLYQRVCK